MRELRPEGVPFKMAGKEYRLFFTLNVIDDIQTHFDCSIAELPALINGTEKINNAKYILTRLINEGISIKADDTGEKPVYLSEEYVGRHALDHAGYSELIQTILQSFIESTNPKHDEDDDPNAPSE